MKHVFPLSYGDDSKLIEIDTALIPFVAGALEYLTQRYAWRTDVDYELGYNAFVQLREELMGKAVRILQMEIRAMRGVDDLEPNITDPDANPFELSLGTLEDNKRAVEAGNAKLEEIRLLIAEMQSAEAVEDIQAKVAQIAILLG